MKLIILVISLLSVNSFAEMGKIKVQVTKDSKFKETRESISNSVQTNGSGETKLTLEQIYKKYGTGDEAQRYIEKNELFDLVEERNKKMN